MTVGMAVRVLRLSLPINGSDSISANKNCCLVPPPSGPCQGFGFVALRLSRKHPIMGQ
jgi:hypothetical protein